MRTTEITAEGCTIDRFTVYSPGMARDIRAAVILPPEYRENPEKRYPILYTFHGMTASYDAFSAMVPLREALREKPMIVTCFDADSGSFYLDSPFPQWTGRKPEGDVQVKSLFTTFFPEEFIPAIDKAYRVNPEQRMLTGFSMGGYGAFHYLLERPRDFIAVSSLSGWFESWTNLSRHIGPHIAQLVGALVVNRERYAALDVFVGIKKQIAAGLPFPPLYLTCGTEDFLLGMNRRMGAFLKEQGVTFEYRETPGVHDQPFWSNASPGIIDFHWRCLK